ncbi:putative dihydroorotase [Babesia bovis T2Bo]|uniref:dihydroorotase n=1 Tax=Babesia bovis TaxID=5865 RepID=A7APN9_BABBO|nr:putative dihydroorotase [Babesia bovis T2Bo]EDO08523.1 putative dihydroorotase [Babesia bovis T2Bo]|eukprot:XP_001612091.1 dihydroorotase [Babesia bovis T2Bo]
MQIPLADDLHCHLRQGELMSLVTPLIRHGGCNRVLVMPNTNPPITNCAQAGEYRRQLMQIEPRVTYLMTLYLSPEVSTDDIRLNAKANHVQGIKCYPVGMTTNSEHGFNSLEEYYPLFAEMERLGLSLHIHGEQPGSNPLRSEAKFVQNIISVAMAFPKLKVVAEHVSTKESLEAVLRVPNLAASITPHHLQIVTEDVLNITSGVTQANILDHVKNPYLYCKPIAQSAENRDALLQAIRTRSPKIFLGSDSAPHTIAAKNSDKPPAGIFTQPYIMGYLATIFKRLDCEDYLEAFVCRNGAEFLDLPAKNIEYMEITDETIIVPDTVGGVLKPFLAGEEITKICIVTTGDAK